jgi:hypothetical protein
MLVNANEFNRIYTLQRFCLSRWQIAAATAQAMASQGAPDELYSKASNRAERWFAMCERLARLNRMATI